MIPSVPYSFSALQGEDFGEVHMGEEGGRSKKRKRTGQERTEEDIRRQRAITGKKGPVNGFDELLRAERLLFQVRTWTRG